MRAITQKSFGTPDVLVPTETDRPVPLAGDVLVRVHAASVDPVDGYVRAGVLPLLGEPPFVLGWDVSGVVEEVVPGVTRFEVGDEVFGMPLFPAAGRCLRRVRGRALAALRPLAGLTAWQALVDTAGLREGQRVLVHGAGGGVGHLAVQIAKARGAEVPATASAAEHDFVRSVGADHVIDYAAGLSGIDVVLDGIGGGYGQRSLPVPAEDGLLITLVERGSAELADQGRLRPHVQHVLRLEEAAKAHELIESRGTRGKIVLTV